MNELGDTLRTMARLADARAIYDKVLALRKQMGENGLVAEEQAAIALLLLEQKAPGKAEPLLRSALVEFEKEDAQPDASSAYILLSRALLMEGRLDDAAQMAGRDSTLSRTGSDLSPRLSADIQSAQVEAAIALRAHHSARAASAALLKLKAAAVSARQLGYFNLECDARLALGHATLAVNAAQGRAQLAGLAEEARSRGYLLVAQAAEEFSRAPAEQIAAIR